MPHFYRQCHPLPAFRHTPAGTECMHSAWRPMDMSVYSTTLRCGASYRIVSRCVGTSLHMCTLPNTPQMHPHTMFVQLTYIPKLVHWLTHPSCQSPLCTLRIDTARMAIAGHSRGAKLAALALCGRYCICVCSIVVVLCVVVCALVCGEERNECGCFCTAAHANAVLAAVFHFACTRVFTQPLTRLLCVQHIPDCSVPLYCSTRLTTPPGHQRGPCTPLLAGPLLDVQSLCVWWGLL